MKTVLNPFSYRALEIKISNMKPRALINLANDLVKEVYNAMDREEKIEHYIYCLKAVVLIKKRLEDISKLSLPYKCLSDYTWTLSLIQRSYNEYYTKMPPLNLLDIFFMVSKVITWDINNIEHIKALNNFYSQFSEHDKKQYDINISFKVPSIGSLSYSDKKKIFSHWCKINIGEDAPVLDLLKTHFNLSKRSIAFADELLEMSKIIHNLQEQYDEENKSRIN